MSKVVRYDILFYRVEYPEERGYRMEPKALPPWTYVTITTENDSKYLTVYSRIHMNKEVRMLPDFSTNFSDEDILKDLTYEIHSRFIQ